MNEFIYGWLKGIFRGASLPSLVVFPMLTPPLQPQGITSWKSTTPLRRTPMPKTQAVLSAPSRTPRLKPAWAPLPTNSRTRSRGFQ